MDKELIKAAVEVTKEAMAHTSTAMTGGLLNTPDAVAEFLDKIAHKLDDLYNNVPPKAVR